MKLLSVAAILSLLAAPALASTANLVALYQFENNDATDSSGNGNNGSVGAGVSFAASQAGFGTAANFTPTAGLSGIDTGVDINFSVMNELTMGGWVKARTDGSRDIGKMLSHDNVSFDRTMGFDTRGDDPGVDFAAFTGSGVADIDGTPIFGAWVHYTVVYDGTNGAIYQNGALAETFTDFTDADSSTFNLFIGTNPGFDEDFDGLMDDIFVFDRALGEKEIRDIYTNGFGPAPVPLPAGLPLLAAGLGTFLALRRRAS